MLLILILVSGLHGQTTYIIKTSDMNIRGTSTMHDWELKATSVTGNCVLNCEGKEIRDIKSFYMEIPTKSLKSVSGSKMMDDKVYTALKSETVQKITFRLEKIISMNATGNGWDVTAAGNLSIAGVTSDDVMVVHITSDPNGGITLSGVKKLKMLDYHIDPPKAMMGALTTGNEIEIEFKINLTKS